MRNVWTIARREYNYYFSTPAAYVVTFMILGILGILFVIQLNVSLYQQFAPGIQSILAPLAWMLIFLAAPALTTRTIASESRLGTIETLLTAPIRDWELVVGKWLGAYLALLSVVATTLVFPILLNALVTPGIDQGAMLAGYLGISLFLAAIVAVGVVISSLFEHQVATFLVTEAVFLILFFVISAITQFMSPSELWGTVLGYFDVQGPLYNNLLRGVLDLRDIAQYLSLTTLALFLTSVSVATRRWR